ncbi:hypothetical protein CLOP_g21121 [Closterium sp. NIES-67]|nr:hypothetical protein CLOP_g21121 [Closterium sp. NIES-67]
MRAKREVHQKAISKRRDKLGGEGREEGEGRGGKREKPTSFKDDQFFINSIPPNRHWESGLSVNGRPKNEFSAEVQKFEAEVLDLAPDDGEGAQKRKAVFHWDKKSKKYIKLNPGETLGPSGKVRTESGAKTSAGSKGIYKRWKERTHMRVGGRGARGGSAFDADEDAGGAGRGGFSRGRGGARGGRGGMSGRGGSGGRVRDELRSVEEVRKMRQTAVARGGGGEEGVVGGEGVAGEEAVEGGVGGEEGEEGEGGEGVGGGVGVEGGEGAEESQALVGEGEVEGGEARWEGAEVAVACSLLECEVVVNMHVCESSVYSYHFYCTNINLTRKLKPGSCENANRRAVLAFLETYETYACGL